MAMLDYFKKRSKTHRVKVAVAKKDKAIRKRMVARSKRVSVEFNIPATRKFDGKKYYAYDFATRRKKAEVIVAEQKTSGYYTRVALIRSGYGIYIRKR